MRIHVFFIYMNFINKFMYFCITKLRIYISFYLRSYQQMPLITLTTDFGIKDHFIGVIKGAIYSEFNAAKIVDITHQISPFHITEAAYILKNAYLNFPKGSIHIIDVDSELSSENKLIALLLDEHYFICADNGVISMITSEFKPEKLVEITISDATNSSKTFARVACHIARGGTLDIIGKETSNFRQLKELNPHINSEKNQIVGSVLYTDNYGNVIINITKKIFQEVGKGRSFVISARKYTFEKVYTNYNAIVNYNTPQENRYDEGKRLALFNSGDYLEISLYKSNMETVGGASSLLGLKYRDTVTIKFN